MAISCFYASISSAETSIVPGDSHVGPSGLLGMTVVFDGFCADFSATNYQITMSLRGADRKDGDVAIRIPCIRRMLSHLRGDNSNS